MHDTYSPHDPARKLMLTLILGTHERLTAAGLNGRQIMIVMFEKTAFMVRQDLPGLVAEASAGIAAIRRRLAEEGLDEAQAAAAMSEWAAMYRHIATAIEEQTKLAPSAVWRGGHA